MANYKPLQIQAKQPKDITEKSEEFEDNYEIELSEEDEFADDNLGFEDDDQDEEEIIEDSEEVIEEETEEPKPVEKEKTTSKRENDRIRSLIEERNSEREFLNKAKEENLVLKKQMLELQKNTVKSSIGVLKDHISGLKKQMVLAKDTDETESFIDLQEKLNKAQLDLSALESWNPPEIKEKVETKSSEIPEVVKDWMEENPWFRMPISDSDKKMQRAAVIYSERLTEMGYDIKTKEYFEALDEYMVSKGFDVTVVAKKESDDVESKNEISSEGRKKKKISQTIQGASRKPVTSQKSKTKIVLSTQQQSIADLYGMSYAEYARELLRVEQSEKAGKRMTTLSI